MSTQVARLCPRCNRYRLRALFDRVRDGLGYIAYVCCDCRQSGDRVIRAARLSAPVDGAAPAGSAEVDR